MPSLEHSPYRFVKIKVDQRWKDKRTGAIVVVRGKRKGEYWAISRQSNSKVVHQISERSLKVFCEPIE